MSKKEKKKKNVFGLVSKLGNLIKIGGTNSTNNENMDTSSGDNELHKKNFNIQISEENQENIELGDEEEEEEEEEEVNVQEEKKDSNDNKKDNENINKKEEIKEKDIKKDNEIINKKKEIKENDIKNDTNKIDNIDNKVISNNINNPEKITENKEEVIQNEIKEENININNNNDEKNNELKSEEKKEKDNNISSDVNKIINIEEKEEIKNIENNNEIKEISDNNNEKNIENLDDIDESCHLYLKIGNDFNSKEIYCISLSKVRGAKKKSFLQKMNVFKKVKDEIINYVVFLDENFIYLAKDIIVDKKNDVLRRIKKIYNIRNIFNYRSEKISEENKYKIEFQTINKKNIQKTKEYFIEEQYYKEFNDTMIKKLKLFGNDIKKDETKKNG